ncbi:MAG TPA: cytidine deaminase [Myxococcota bacterium]
MVKRPAPSTAIDARAEDVLVHDAVAARASAYAPYSSFHVGAALLCDDGVIVRGCNVENASYGLCICAERNAIGTAVAQGRRAFRAIAVATSSTPPSSPCGMCRQVLAELAPGIPVILVSTATGTRKRTTVDALLPDGFDAALLRSGQARDQGKSSKKKRRA